MLSKHFKKPFITAIHISLLIITGIGKLLRRSTNLPIPIKILWKSNDTHPNQYRVTVHFKASTAFLGGKEMTSFRRMEPFDHGVCSTNMLDNTIKLVKCCQSENISIYDLGARGTRGFGYKFWLPFRRALQRTPELSTEGLYSYWTISKQLQK